MDENNNFTKDFLQIVFTFVMPTLTIIPIIMNLMSAFIFSNIEFKTQTYRYLKLNSIIDAISLGTILFLPVTQCQELCAKWWTNNYWLVVYEIYINNYISRSLRTVSSILSVTIAWKRFRTMNQYKINNNNFYFIISSIFMFSFVLYLPALFLSKISSNNSTGQIYTLRVAKLNVYNQLSLIYYLVTILILILTVILNAKLVFKIKEQLNLKFRSIKFKSANDCKIVEFLSLNTNTVNLRPVLVDDRLKTYRIIFSRNKIVEFETTLLIIWITLVFIIDQFLQTISASLFLFIDKTSQKYILILIFLFLIIVSTQLFNVYFYYKYNRAFSRRFRLLIKSFS
jgi:hypothetical protein